MASACVSATHLCELLRFADSSLRHAGNPAVALALVHCCLRLCLRQCLRVPPQSTPNCAIFHVFQRCLRKPLAIPQKIQLLGEDGVVANITAGPFRSCSGGSVFVIDAPITSAGWVADGACAVAGRINSVQCTSIRG